MTKRTKASKATTTRKESTTEPRKPGKNKTKTAHTVKQTPWPNDKEIGSYVPQNWKETKRPQTSAGLEITYAEITKKPTFFLHKKHQHHTDYSLCPKMSQLGMKRRIDMVFKQYDNKRTRKSEVLGREKIPCSGCFLTTPASHKFQYVPYQTFHSITPWDIHLLQKKTNL